MTFKRTNDHKASLDDTWRKPRGTHNKRRKGHRGKPKVVKPGYRTPKDERHKKDGLKIKRIQNEQDFNEADPDKHALNIDNMGRKKKTQLIKKGLEQDFTFVNLDPEEYVETTEDFLKKRKERREEIKQKKEEQKEQTEQESQETDDEERTDPEEQQEKDREAAEEAITKSK